MLNSSSQLRIVVLGYIIRGPVGGMAWHHLQYVMGLKRLGHEVYFVEDSDDYPSCYDPSRHGMQQDPTYGLQFAKTVFDRLGLADCWSYYDAHTAQWMGPRADDILHICSHADLLLNISAVNPLRPWLMDVPVRVFIDTDPVFTQIRHLTKSSARRLAEQHTDFFTFGENIASGQSACPADGFSWQPTRQPIVLDAWPQSSASDAGPFTTVMQWDSYSPLEYQGRMYGMKSASFDGYLNLPQQTAVPLEIALGSESAPRELLQQSGWLLRDPLEVTRDPWTYQRYIEESRGEFSVAKHGYVAARSGWFSERSAAYLASGRPVVLQETGFSNWISCGRGLLVFTSLGQAITALEEVSQNLQLHCRAAREICEAYFRADEILQDLVEKSCNR